ncbi:NAD(P)-dependent benzaldehyde dehydrogenase MdlD [Pantoea coffeiphila]|uniref:NAD(P)-dependent benzaldehyde dehydrogenase MdlD n=1 Tax=Pantoea coffeiphila TaxID=1465635 RepID=UPI001961F100|nr:aldehyde dehydrogenase family protein [Pantoea coffeiphila]MBM7342057.1 aldehyde dehydrogenase (NAD+) [Pantoea coffeiphila]
MINQQGITELFHGQKRAFLAGKTQSVEQRAAALHKLKQVILANREAIHHALESDLGKTPDIVDLAEIGAVIEEIDGVLAGLAGWAEDEVFPLSGFLAGSEGRICAEPYGVCYIIGPFNYPFNLALTPLVGAIAAGNTAIIKPSEATPATSAVIKAVVEQAFAVEWVAVVEGGRAENEILLSLPFDFFFFTGSPTVGKIVMKAAAEHLAPVVLELGGKCPVVVFEDADLDHLVERLAFSKYLNSGQTCVAPDYLLVPEALRDTLASKLAAVLRAGFNGQSIGKVVSERQIEKLAGYLEKTGGNVVVGGGYDKASRQFEPTVVTHVGWDDALMQDEIFGPILPIITYADLDECRQNIITRHAKPLALYAFSRDEERALAFIKSIQSGDAQINDILTHVLSAELPFGGIGPSGMGKYHGKASFDVYSHRRSVRTVSCK